MRLGTLAPAVGLLSLVVAGSATAQDAAKGKAVFVQCSACHKLDSNLVGPKLEGVVDRKAGIIEDYAYSPLMKAAVATGLYWTVTELTGYLKNPTEYLTRRVRDAGGEAHGQSKMLFNLSNEQQRKDVVAYLATRK